MKQLYATVYATVTAVVEVTVCLPQGYTPEDLESAVKGELNRNPRVTLEDLEDVDNLDVVDTEEFDNEDVD